MDHPLKVSVWLRKAVEGNEPQQATVSLTTDINTSALNLTKAVIFTLNVHPTTLETLPLTLHKMAVTCFFL